MIEAHGLTKCYGTHIAIEDISFSVERGEILGFLGPNGAGKTTTGYESAQRDAAAGANADAVARLRRRGWG